LTSGKHLPGITNDAFFGPDPLSPLRSMWVTVPFDVGRDYAMWASITVKQKMRPTSQRNPGPHHTGISGPHRMESLAHMDRNTQPSGFDFSFYQPMLNKSRARAGSPLRTVQM
jgi:hypothetical protein